MFLPLSPDTEIGIVDDDSVTELPDLQVPVRISEIRRNVQLNVLAERLQRRAQIKVYKRQKELQNKEDGSTSSASTPEVFVEPSASSDPSEPENPRKH